MGKTTLIVRVFEMLKASNPNLKIKGFYTRKQIPSSFCFSAIDFAMDVPLSQEKSGKEASVLALKSLL